MTRSPLSALTLLIGLAGCTESEMPGPGEGETLFLENCAACHGLRGEGGESLVGGQVAPDLTMIALRNGGNFPQAEVLSQIDGYARGSLPSDVMPEFGALLQGETVPVDIAGTMTPTPRPLAALLAYLESIQVP